MSDKRPSFIGLTGAIGAGKSTALSLLEELGAAVISSDQIVHDLYGTSAVREAVVERWGHGVVMDGIVDRAAIAEHVFSSNEERTWLETLLWPLVLAEIARWRAVQERLDPGPVALVVEVPLLFEAGMEGSFDATIAVVAPEEILDERVRGRAYSRGERAAAQLSADEKAARATVVVDNSGSPSELKESLLDVLKHVS